MESATALSDNDIKHKNFRVFFLARKVMVDLKFEALYRYVFIESHPEVGLVEKFIRKCIGGSAESANI